jgi:hypothetical protein
VRTSITPQRPKEQKDVKKTVEFKKNKKTMNYKIKKKQLKRSHGQEGG